MLSASLGCAFTFEHRPEEFDLDEPWPRLTAGEPIAVRAGPAPAGWRSIELPALVFKLDLQVYTHSLVRRVEQALVSQNVATRSDSQRWMELDVVYATILRGGGDGYDCVVDFTVRTGDGYVFGHQARERSVFIEKACNAALSRAAYVALNDPNVRAYLGAS
jgi:hypothetical protein